MIFAGASPRTQRFVHDWLSAHKHDAHRSDGLLRHDQVPSSRSFSCDTNLAFKCAAQMGSHVLASCTAPCCAAGCCPSANFSAKRRG